MRERDNFQISQKYTVLPPRVGNAYLVPCNEWDRIKGKIKNLSSEPLFFQSFGFLLLGVAATSLTSVLLKRTENIPMAGAIVAVGVICGLSSLYVAHCRRALRRERASDVVAQMEMIEQRHEGVSS